MQRGLVEKGVEALLGGERDEDEQAEAGGETEEGPAEPGDVLRKGLGELFGR